MADSFDVVIIGSGPGGYVAAIRAGQLGLSTAIVEKEKRLGGTCLHKGCIPTKSLLWTAELFAHLGHASTFGIEVGSASIDWQKAHQHKEKVVAKGAGGVDFLMKKNKVTVLKGHGRIAGRGEVEVRPTDGSPPLSVKAKWIIVATGSIPSTLPSIVVDHQRVLDSDSMLELKVLPKSLVVLGAGAVGTEFASIFNHVGAEVTLIELLPSVLPIEDRDISRELERHLKRRKIDLLTGTRFERLERTDSGVRVWVTPPDGQSKVLEAEYFLSAVGRTPLTGDCGLERTSIKRTPRGAIPVDEMMRTTEPGVYAIGDVTPHPMLAHCASAQGMVAVEHIAGKNPRPVDYRRIPNATYCYPEVASVGLTEQAARDQGHDVRIGTFPFSAITKAAISDEAIGLVKIVSEKKYDEVLGVHMCGPHATELLAEACVALKLESTTEELAQTVHAHPTLSEALHEVAAAALGHPIHI